MLEGAHGAVAALLAASREAANLLSDVGTGEGAPLAGRALPVQTSGRAACLWGNTWVRAQLWPVLPRAVTSIPTPCPHDLLPHPSTHPPVAPQLCPRQPPWGVPLRTSVTPSYRFPSLNLATSSCTCPRERAAHRDGVKRSKTPLNPCQRPTWESELSQSVKSRTGLGLTSADLGVAGAALAGRPRAGGPGTSPGAELLPPSAGDTAVFPGPPGTPHPRTRAARHLPALQGALHTGAGDREGDLRRQDPGHLPPRALLPSSAAYSPPCFPGLTSCHRAQSPPLRVPASPRS